MMVEVFKNLGLLDKSEQWMLVRKGLWLYIHTNESEVLLSEVEKLSQLPTVNECIDIHKNLNQLFEIQTAVFGYSRLKNIIGRSLGYLWTKDEYRGDDLVYRNKQFILHDCKATHLEFATAIRFKVRRKKVC